MKGLSSTKPYPFLNLGNCCLAGQWTGEHLGRTPVDVLHGSASCRSTRTTNKVGLRSEISLVKKLYSLFPPPPSGILYSAEMTSLVRPKGPLNCRHRQKWERKQPPGCLSPLLLSGWCGDFLIGSLPLPPYTADGQMSKHRRHGASCWVAAFDRSLYVWWQRNRDLAYAVPVHENPTHHCCCEDLQSWLAAICMAQQNRAPVYFSGTYMTSYWTPVDSWLVEHGLLLQICVSEHQQLCNIWHLCASPAGDGTCLVFSEFSSCLTNSWSTVICVTE